MIMRLSTFLFVIGLTPFTRAQNATSTPTAPPGFPPCAGACISASQDLSGCTQSNLTCICRNPTFVDAVQICEASGCSISDIQQIIQGSTQLCATVGGVYNDYSLLSSNSTSCTNPTGKEYYPLPAPTTLGGQRIFVTQSFALAHSLFNLTDLNTADPQSTIVAACSARCDTFGTKCASFFVNLGIPDPPLPSGQSQARRWYCHGYDAALTPEDFGIATTPDTYLSPEAFNRACGETVGTNGTMGPSPTTSATETPTPFMGGASSVESGVWGVIVSVGMAGVLVLIAWL